MDTLDCDNKALRLTPLPWSGATFLPSLVLIDSLVLGDVLDLTGFLAVILFFISLSSVLASFFAGHSRL